MMRTAGALREMGLGLWSKVRLVALVGAATLGLAACAGSVEPTPPLAQANPPQGAQQGAQTPGHPLMPSRPASDQKVRVGLLLPLSGPSAATGEALLDAAQMAVFDLADDRFELLPRDTGDTPDGAGRAAQSAIAAGARLLLGPLYASAVPAVRAVAQPAGVTVLAFSNDRGVAGNGAFIMGFVPADQVARVVSYTMGRGLARFAVLTPSSPYGDAVMSALSTTTARGRASVLTAERYAPGTPDLGPTVRRLADFDHREASGAGAAAIDVPYQALLVGEGGGTLRAIAPLLALYQINPQRVHILGTGLWDEPDLGRQAPLVGAWFAAPDPSARASFEAHFTRLYGRRPLRIATLGYDAAALATVLGRTPGRPSFDAVALTNANGFAGVDGVFRLRPDGTTERGLAVMEVTPTGNRVIDPAPTSFQGVGQ